MNAMQTIRVPPGRHDPPRLLGLDAPAQVNASTAADTLVLLLLHSHVGRFSFGCARAAAGLQRASIGVM